MPAKIRKIFYFAVLWFSLFMDLLTLLPSDFMNKL